MKRSNLEKFMNPNASPEHRSAVEALCVDLDPNSDLYKCLLQTTNTQEIDECFQQYANKTGNPVITSSIEQEEDNNNNSSNNKCPSTNIWMSIYNIFISIMFHFCRWTFIITIITIITIIVIIILFLLY